MLNRRIFSLGLPLVALATGEARAQTQSPAPDQQQVEPAAQAPPEPPIQDQHESAADGNTFSQEEIVGAASGFFDTTAGAAGAAVERIFRENGRPVGYIQGQEGAGAWGFGLRYGKGLLYLKSGARENVFWQGPSFGFDFGGNASKVFTLVYGMTNASEIYQRFPGVEGSAYFIGGLGVNYQRAETITLAPMRAGVGLRAGANVGYLSYSRKRHIIPF